MKHSSALTTGLNILTLLIGIGIGMLIKTSPAVQAQAPPPTRIEEITPMITGGAAGFGTLLSNNLEADHLVVNGYDVMKLEDGILAYLASRPLAERADIQKIIDNSRPDVFYKIKIATTPTPTPTASPLSSPRSGAK